MAKLYQFLKASFTLAIAGTFLGTLALFSSAAFAADLSDLGVPAGWRAMDYDKRGRELLNKHDYETARRYLTAAIRLEPDRWSAYYNRAETYYQQKNWTAVLQDLNATIRVKPSFFDATFKRAQVYQHLHNYRAALHDFDVLADVTRQTWSFGGLQSALNGRAWLRATCPDPSIRNAQLALADAKKACEMDKWKSGSYLDTLAAAYAEAGDFDSAIKYEEQAIPAHNAQPEQIVKELRLNKTISKRIQDDMAQSVRKSAPGFVERLNLYKQHRPCREAEPPEY